MATDAPSARELDAFRDRADRFLAELDEEFYLHYGGLKERLELEPIYERYADLTTLERAQSLAAVGADGDSHGRELWRFACEGYLGRLTREHEEKVAALETELKLVDEGREIPFRLVRPAIANEPDRARRERLDRARVELTTERLNPIYLDAARVAHAAVPELGAPSYLELYRRFRFPLDPLADQCRAFLDETEKLYERHFDRLLRDRLGIPLAEARRYDIQRLFRAAEWDQAFTPEGMLPALEGTLADLGIDLRAQANVVLDLEQREQKSPRAFCAPIEVPDRVVLVIQPIGGADDWRALFHEAGHTEHFAHTRRELAMEEKRLGDNAVTEGWAMLLQHLTDEPAWLSRRLDFPRPEVYAAEGAIGLLYFVRRYCGKLLYELEFHQAEDVTQMEGRYVEILGEALKIEPAAADYLSDLDAGFYVSAYLRSWAFEAQLRNFLREEFGRTWFARREAGSLLRELWAEGQRPTADELLKDVAGTELELSAVADRVREAVG